MPALLGRQHGLVTIYGSDFLVTQHNHVVRVPAEMACVT